MENITCFPDLGLPLGFRFSPTDEELIVHYLLKKIHGNPLPFPAAVIDCDVYGDNRAWRRLFEESEEKSLYFFTRPRKETGEWKRVRRGKKIFRDGNDRREHIGSKRSFTFEPKNGVEETGKWVMHEYRLDGCLSQEEEEDLYVVCKIKNDGEKKKTENWSNTFNGRTH